MNDLRLLLAKTITTTVLQLPYRQDPFDTRNDDWLFDFRTIILVPEHLEIITTLLFEHIKHLPRVQICGLESAAIPLVTALVLHAHRQGHVANGFYIRKSRKKSGMRRLIEGEVTDDPIIIVDDLLNRGESKHHIISCLEDLGKKVQHILTIINYYPKAHYADFLKKHIEISSIYELSEFNLTISVPPVVLSNPYQKITLYQPSISSHRHVVTKSVPALASDGSIFFGTDEGYLVALGATGDVLWKFKTGKHSQGKSIFSSPVAIDDVVIFGAYDGHCYCLDRYYGAVKWVYDGADWIGSSPAVSIENKALYIGLEHSLPGQRGSVAAINYQTGKLLWEQPSAALTHASPLYLKTHNLVYCGGNDGVMSAYHATTGKLAWRFVSAGGSSYLPTSGYSRGDIKSRPAFDPDTNTLAFCSMDGWMYVVNAQHGTLLFKHHTDYVDTHIRGGIYGSPVYHGSQILFAGLDKTLYCLDKHTGQVQWSAVLGGRIFSSPVVVMGRVFIGCNDGQLYEYTLATGQLLSRTYFGERVTNPVVYDATTHSMLVSTNDNHVHRLLLT